MADGRTTMDFFAAQAAAKRRTGVLVVLFALAWAVTVILADLGVTLVFAGTEPSLRDGYAAATASELASPVDAGRARFLGLLLPVAGVVSTIVLLGTAWHVLRLGRDGGDAVARMLGGVPVDRSSQDPGERRAVNVLEEMAIAAAVPVPRLYLLPEETSVNAFAAGYTPERAVVGVTRGALDRLTRDELQGVFAHELSHVLNADARLNLRLVSLVGGLTALALVGRLLLRILGNDSIRLRSRGRGKGAGIYGAVFAVGLVFLVAGAVGSFFARLIRLAVSRQREFLADAAAVQFTRNPAGLAGALSKIRAHGSALASPHAPEVAHFFFANGLGGITAGFLSTHPALEERMERIQAGPLPAPAASRAPAAAPQGAPDTVAAPPPWIALAPQRGATASPAPGGLGPLTGGALGAAALPLAAVAAASVGRPAPEHLARAHATLAALPPALARAAREPFGARAVALALLVDDADPALRQRQLGAVRDPVLSREVDQVAGALGVVSRQDRLALLDLTLPALDALSPEQARALVRELAALAAADGRTTLFEWALQRLVRRRLRPLLGEARRVPRVHALGQVEVETLDLLSALAWAGHPHADTAQQALDAGVRALGIRAPWRVLPRERIDVHRLDAALERLEGADPAVMAQLLAGAAACVLSDARVTAAEAELLRAVAATMGLPMPALPSSAGARAVTAA